jgi:hypothetical protein
MRQRTKGRFLLLSVLGLTYWLCEGTQHHDLALCLLGANILLLLMGGGIPTSTGCTPEIQDASHNRIGMKRIARKPIVT